ncbi:unnamed protein product [Chilo suppressalis]|uniref:A kinase-anchoring proteins AKAP-5 and AKAP-12 calmodulin (CaM)-binding domain-containing protein n=1 Tax=Chilo suppressalis TaxID=168631 RepID=A0ABN8EEV1_CHISP|nr:hypothetical protein evm_009235 [Chilo suppressalis]CAH0692941.1 unnamed protein product [Chilo suppressalis]
MGAKQSKRSVDISGKEAEGAGEVAAAGAGGEGRMEPLADADALKPQLNGDAHIHEQTDKEKQLDIGTPENEKDATTEKEEKQEDSEQKEIITNGDNSEQKTENDESAPTPEESKKPKKEKVKKKWSLRSISFSRKDKPKQEKKQKEEEPKLNGDTEKVPEEAAEVTAETVKNEDTEVKPNAEIKEEKTPETPVTEPITNGSNTPETPKEEVVVKEAPVTSVESDKPETKTEPEPEKLPINGLSIEEPIKEEPEIPKIEESQPKESSAEPTETVPAVEIPVQNEVCVEQMPLIESTPPPLPANPPPSSVATFAATTMAPDLTDASLANTAQTAISTPPTLDTKAELPKECLSESSHTVLTNNESDIHVPSSTKTSQEEVNATTVGVEEILETPIPVEQEADSEVKKDESDIKDVDENIKMEVELNGSEPEIPETPVLPESPTLPETLDSDTSDTTGDLPPPPPPEDADDDTLNDDVAIEKIEPPTIDELQEANNVVDAHISNRDVSETNGIDKEEKMNGNLETQLKAMNVVVLENAMVECNGNTLEECEAEESQPARASASPPPASQEPVAVSDKMADLIPEVPVVPVLNTETLQETSDAVVAN